MDRKTVVEKYGVAMVECGDKAAVYYNGEKVFEGDFFEAGRVYTKMEKEAHKLQPEKQYQTTPTATASWKDVLHYAMSRCDAGYYEFPDSEEGRQVLAERYRKTLIEYGETEIPIPLHDDDSTPVPQDTYLIRGYGVVEKRILPGNKSSGRLNLPLNRVGQRVKVVFLEPEPRENRP